MNVVVDLQSIFVDLHAPAGPVGAELEEPLHRGIGGAHKGGWTGGLYSSMRKLGCAAAK